MKLRKRIYRLILQPIRVFVFHQVSEYFEADTMWKCDWTEIEQFKKNIFSLESAGYSFITLEEAYNRVKKDIVRTNKYAVLTADDGWKSIKNILPWLIEKKIPLTVFVNPYYLDGKHFQERNTEQFIRREDLQWYSVHYPHLIKVASHCWAHKNVCTMTKDEFINSINLTDNFLSRYSNYIRFVAYPYGTFSKWHNDFLYSNNYVPVLVDGEKNYCDSQVIHRECIDGININ